MIPKQQNVVYYDANPKQSFEEFCQRFIQDGWIIHQAVSSGYDCFYLILYSY